MAWIALLRPKQWVKNIFVLAPLVFALEWSDGDLWFNAALAVLVFVFASCAVYIYNDIYDITADKEHPIKQLRPIASGKISVGLAFFLALVFASLALGLTLWLPDACSLVLAIYVALNLLYTRWLKAEPIIDVMIIASGYVLRVLMGGFAVGVYVSPWILIASFVLALFLAFGKRYSEYQLFGKISKTRPSLCHYNEHMLRGYVHMSCIAACVTYMLYVVDLIKHTGQSSLVYTIVFVVFGLFRYVQRLYVSQAGEEPEAIILKDPYLLVNASLWVLVFLSIRLGLW